MTTPEHDLLRSVEEFRDFLSTVASPHGVSAAGELTMLDRLVRKYPEAARVALARFDQEQARKRG